MSGLSTDPFDVLIIGNGAAGLGLALSLATEYRVAVFCKDDFFVSSSQYAQGGIAAVLNPTDSHASHIADTLQAGAGLCDNTTVEYTVHHAKSAIEWLIAHGVPFTVDQGNYHLTQEGGHSQRRIIHVADKTGAAVVKTLAAQVQEHPHICSFTQHTAIDLLIQNQRCYGASFVENNSREIKYIRSRCTVLATGGASMAYWHTTNSSHTTGDGIAMAFRAGARVANMEFNQFHPTCFYNPHGPTFLISEVLRGEGGQLVLANGEPFMSRYDARADLAPRDVVARAINHEMKTKNLTHVYLDMRKQNPEKIKKLFPTIDQLCRSVGLDMTKAMIPIVPAAHYTCGGVITNLQGETDIAGLFAVGEVACTGLHGANRMASNSLLECVVFAKSAAQKIRSDLTSQKECPLPSTVHADKNINPENINLETIQSLTVSLRTIVWNGLGIVRNNAGLKQARLALDRLKSIHVAPIHKLSIEFRNLKIIADLMLTAAEQRQESRGTHYNEDYPYTDPIAKNTILTFNPNSDNALTCITVTYAEKISNLVRVSRSQ